MYLILIGQKQLILDATDTLPTVSNGKVFWDNVKSNTGTFVEVPDGTWSPADGYGKRWNGSALEDVPVATDPDEKYNGIGLVDADVVFEALTVNLSTSEYVEFRAHGMYDVLMKQDTLNFDDPKGRQRIKNGLALLISQTSITQEKIDVILDTLRG